MSASTPYSESLLRDHEIKANPFNLDGIHSQVEMLLSALFDGSYSQQEKTLLANNGSLEYRYTKGPVGNRMSIRIVSLNRPLSRLTVRFADKESSFPISTRLINHPLLDLTQCLGDSSQPIVQHKPEMMK